MKSQVNARISKATRQKLDELAAVYGTQAEVLAVAIDRLYTDTAVILPASLVEKAKQLGDSDTSAGVSLALEGATMKSTLDRLTDAVNDPFTAADEIGKIGEFPKRVASVPGNPTTIEYVTSINESVYAIETDDETGEIVRDDRPWQMTV